jgi:hypothetical protein
MLANRRYEGNSRFSQYVVTETTALFRTAAHSLGFLSHLRAYSVGNE